MEKTKLTPKTLRFKAMQVRGAYRSRYMIDLASLLDVAASAWEKSDNDFENLAGVGMNLDLENQSLRGQLALSEQARQSAETRLVETILAWRAGEKPEDYPDLAALTLD